MKQLKFEFNELQRDVVTWKIKAKLEEKEEEEETTNPLRNSKLFIHQKTRRKSCCLACVCVCVSRTSHPFYPCLRRTHSLYVIFCFKISYHLFANFFGCFQVSTIIYSEMNTRNIAERKKTQRDDFGVLFLSIFCWILSTVIRIRC